MTLRELLNAMPELDYTAYNSQPPGGGEIDHNLALQRLGAYARFKNDHNLDQSISVGFDSEKLIDWMLKNRGKINEIKVFFGLDDDGKFIVVFWPYKNGIPAITEEGNESSIALDAYNIGSRQPLW